jgi:hypothetical protein
MRFFATLILLGCLVIPAQATAVTIDFEEFTTSTAGPIVSQDFRFDGFQLSATSINITGSTFALVDTDGPISMEHVGGELFSLSAMDLGLSTYDQTFSPTGSNFASIAVTGFLDGGGVVQSSFDVNSWQVSNANFSGWDNLTRVDIEFTDYDGCHSCGLQYFFHSVDNIGVSVIPIPAAVWLFGSGLGLLGWFRNKA